MIGLNLIDTMGVLDNITTGLNFMEEAYGVTASPTRPFLLR